LDSMIIESHVAEGVQVYTGARIRGSQVAERCVVGNFSRVDESELEEAVRIDRNNHLYRCRVGRFSYTGMSTVAMVADIGRFCSISWGVSIGGADHDYRRVAQHSFLYNDRDGLRPIPEPAYDRFAERLAIGHDVWIAANAVVCRGVTVGDGAVVGANAVVTRDVPPYAVVAGAPARVIRHRFKPEIVDMLQQLRWWNWPDEDIRKSYAILSEPPDARTLQGLMAIAKSIQLEDFSHGK